MGHQVAAGWQQTYLHRASAKDRGQTSRIASLVIAVHIPCVGVTSDGADSSIAHHAEQPRCGMLRWGLANDSSGNDSCTTSSGVEHH